MSDVKSSRVLLVFGLEQPKAGCNAAMSAELDDSWDTRPSPMSKLTCVPRNDAYDEKQLNPRKQIMSFPLFTEVCNCDRYHWPARSFGFEAITAVILRQGPHCRLSRFDEPERGEESVSSSMALLERPSAGNRDCEVAALRIFRRYLVFMSWSMLKWW